MVTILMTLISDHDTDDTENNYDDTKDDDTEDDTCFHQSVG